MVFTPHAKYNLKSHLHINIVHSDDLRSQLAEPRRVKVSKSTSFGSHADCGMRFRACTPFGDWRQSRQICHNTRYLPEVTPIAAISTVVSPYMWVIEKLEHERMRPQPAPARIFNRKRNQIQGGTLLLKPLQYLQGQHLGPPQGKIT